MKEEDLFGESDIEIFIRGWFMKITCSIEFTLYAIMVRASNGLNRMNEFKDMRMHNKIECAIADLKKYKPDLYNEYKADLEKLWIFKEFRNMLCHRPMVINPDLETYKFAYIGDHEGEASMIEETYTIDKTYDFITDYFNLSMTLSGLVEKMNHEAEQRPTAT